MKKLIAILTIAIVLVGAVFADGTKLTLTSTVQKHIPGFKLYGIEQSDNNTAISETDTYLATENGTSVGSTKDISIDPITILCRVRQDSNTATYDGAKSKFKGVASISVVASPLTCTIATGNDAGTYKAYPDATVAEAGNHAPNGVTKTTFAAGQTDTIDTAAGTKKDKVSITWTYAGSAIQDSAVYADFSFTWAQDDNLVPGTYTADITMTYTVV